MFLTAGAVAVPIIQASTQHREQIEQDKLHTESELLLDIEIARRCVLNEFKDQMNGKLSTLMILDSLMLAACFGIVVEGFPPRKSPDSVLQCWTSLIALSLCGFFLSVWLIMKIQSRMSRFSITNPNLRYACGKCHPGVHSYWNCHCEFVFTLARGTYYIATLLLFSAAGLDIHCRFAYKYQAPEAGIVFCSIILLFFGVLVIANITIRSGPKLKEEELEWTFDAYDMQQSISVASSASSVSSAVMDASATQVQSYASRIASTFTGATTRTKPHTQQEITTASPTTKVTDKPDPVQALRRMDSYNASYYKKEAKKE